MSQLNHEENIPSEVPPNAGLPQNAGGNQLNDSSFFESVNIAAHNPDARITSDYLWERLAEISSPTSIDYAKRRGREVLEILNACDENSAGDTSCLPVSLETRLAAELLWVPHFLQLTHQDLKEAGVPSRIAELVTMIAPLRPNEGEPDRWMAHWSNLCIVLGERSQRSMGHCEQGYLNYGDLAQGTNALREEITLIAAELTMEMGKLNQLLEHGKIPTALSGEIWNNKRELLKKFASLIERELGLEHSLAQRFGDAFLKFENLILGR